MTDTTTAAAPTTMQEIDQALHAAKNILPIAITTISAVEPKAAALTPLLPAFNAVVAAADVIAEDTGKPLSEVVSDIVSHLTKGQPNSPSLAPAASTK